MDKVVKKSYASYLQDGKKSFSLVELAIYIVAVGILTGVAVGGMEVVNNAKIQKISEEMDNYRSAMYLFNSIYLVLPGNVSSDICKQKNEFNNISAPGANDDAGKYCATDYTVETANDTLLATEDSENSFLNAMRFLVASGIKSDAARTNLYNATAGSSNAAISASDLTYTIVRNSQGVSTYSDDAAYTYVGFSGTKNGLAMVRGMASAAELAADATDKSYYNLIAGKNILVYYQNQNTTTTPNVGVLNSVMAKKLSVKIDNNTKPNEGKVLALKNGGTATRKCYNGAEFLNSKDAKEGCNMIFVLE